MKYLKTRQHTVLLFLLMALTGLTKSQAQTDLSPGDILFTGYNCNASTTDAFSFVLLVPITSGTVIRFTDNAWLPTNVFRVGEQTVIWTANEPLAAGKEITISGPSAGAGIAILAGQGTTTGTCTGSIPSLATSGDQVIAYQIQTGVNVPIAGIHMNVYSTDLGQCGNTTASNWDPSCIVDNANFSVMPQGLAPNFSAMWIGTEGTGASEQDNARFNCTGTFNTVANLRASVTNMANWNANSVAPPDANVVLPSNCAFMTTSLSVELIEFAGSARQDHILLQWETAHEKDHDAFIVEKSGDGQHFSMLETIKADGDFSYLTRHYSYEDRKVLEGANYYRLKMIGKDGSVTYSAVVTVQFKGSGGSKAMITPNPATTSVHISIPAADYNYVRITDMVGRIALQQSVSGQAATLNTTALQAGRYMLTLTGKAEKYTTQLVIAP